MRAAKVRTYLKHFVVVAVGSSLILTSGCLGGKKKGRAGSGIEDIGGITQSDMGGLSGRPDWDTTEMANQFNAVQFAYDSSQVAPAERNKIDAVADALRSDRTAGLIIEGHCDERGSREYNLALGERRGLAVRAYLIGLGVDGTRIQTKSFGEEQPVAFGHDESSWQKNRRAAFVLFY